MAKYLIHASYTAEGLKGLQKDKASGRRAPGHRRCGQSKRPTRHWPPKSATASPADDPRQPAIAGAETGEARRMIIDTHAHTVPGTMLDVLKSEPRLFPSVRLHADGPMPRLEFAGG